WSVDGMQVGYKGEESKKPSSEMDQAIRATRNMVLSNTGSYEGMITPFPAQWGTNVGAHAAKANGAVSRITLFDAEEMGKNGKHAAQILGKAFPGSHIELIH